MAGWVAREKEDRAAARTWLARIEGLAEESELGAERLARLRAEAEPVRRSLALDEAAQSGCTRSEVGSTFPIEMLGPKMNEGWLALEPLDREMCLLNPRRAD